MYKRSRPPFFDKMGYHLGETEKEGGLRRGKERYKRRRAPAGSLSSSPAVLVTTSPAGRTAIDMMVKVGF